MKRLLGYRIHSDAEFVFEVLLQRNAIQERYTRFKVDEQVDVALGWWLTAGEGAEDAHVVGPVACDEGQGQRAFLLQRTGGVSDPQCVALYRRSYGFVNRHTLLPWRNAARERMTES